MALATLELHLGIVEDFAYLSISQEEARHVSGDPPKAMSVRLTWSHPRSTRRELHLEQSTSVSFCRSSS